MFVCTAYALLHPSKQLGSIPLLADLVPTFEDKAGVLFLLKTVFEGLERVQQSRTKQFAERTYDRSLEIIIFRVKPLLATFIEVHMQRTVQTQEQGRDQPVVKPFESVQSPQLSDAVDYVLMPGLPVLEQHHSGLYHHHRVYS